MLVNMSWAKPFCPCRGGLEISSLSTQSWRTNLIPTPMPPANLAWPRPRPFLSSSSAGQDMDRVCLSPNETATKKHSFQVAPAHSLGSTWRVSCKGIRQVKEAGGHCSACPLSTMLSGINNGRRGDERCPQAEKQTPLESITAPVNGEQHACYSGQRLLLK